jgi:hypothetical protein
VATKQERVKFALAARETACRQNLIRNELIKLEKNLKFGITNWPQVFNYMMRYHYSLGAYEILMKYRKNAIPEMDTFYYFIYWSFYRIQCLPQTEIIQQKVDPNAASHLKDMMRLGCSLDKLSKTPRSTGPSEFDSLRQRLGPGFDFLVKLEREVKLESLDY